jgi:hypothetical protein
MSRAANFFLAILTLAAFLSSGLAQQSANPSATRSMLVNVFDLHGNAIRDLTKAAFRIRLNGKSATVLDAKYSFAPRRIVILLDTSGSMGGDPGNKKWKIAHDAVQELLAQAPVDAPIAMMTFSSQIQESFHFSQSRASLTNWLKEGPSEGSLIKGRTALFDTIFAALDSLRPFRTGDAIYAITDGGDNMSHVSAARLRRALSDSGVRLFALLLGGNVLPSEKGARQSFLEMVIESGGFVFGVSGLQIIGRASWEVEYDHNQHTLDRIKAYTQELNTQVQGFWIVELAAPATNKASKIKLEIVDPQGRTRKDIAFTYQRVLTPATGALPKAK